MVFFVSDKCISSFKHELGQEIFRPSCEKMLFLYIYACLLEKLIELYIRNVIVILYTLRGRSIVIFSSYI